MPNETLTIAVSTLGDRIGGLALPPPRAGVDWLILVQRPGPDPLLPAALAGRADLRLERLDSLGVAHSRNAAIDRARGALLLFSDDDIVHDMDGVAQLCAALSADPDLSFVAGRRRGVTRRYPAARCRLTRFNSAHVATPELMIRPERFRAAGVAFDPRFGLGARWPLADEYVLIGDALRAGLRGAFLPVDIGTHPPESSGDDWADPVRLTARAKALNRVFGPLVLPAALAFAGRHRARIGGPRALARFLRDSLTAP